MNKEYNGHHCWTCWNVALWIGNDEGLYRLALACKRNAENLTYATNYMMEHLDEKTPDGAKYTHKAVRAALAALEG